MKKVLITGGSGLVGTVLTSLLQENGYEVAHLSRTPDSSGSVKVYGWDIKKGEIDKEALKSTFAVIHLAGAGIAEKRWTASRKKTIVDSRVNSADLLMKACTETGEWPEVYLSASGINYYGADTSSHIHKETDAPASSFIGECCVQWEAAAGQFDSQCRVAMLRTGIVLSESGGALPKIAAPIKFGFGAPLGSGDQWVPYIHIEDLCRMYLFALENSEVKGPYNAVNGDHITNRDLTRAIARKLDKPLWLPAVPAFALKLVLGEMSELLLEGSRASAWKIENAGFEFTFPKLNEALGAIYSKN